MIIPESIGSLNNLEYLDLHNNNIGNVPNSIELLNQLTILHLYQNNLIELDLDFDKLNNLELLWINDNQITSIDNSICDIMLDLNFYCNNNKLCENYPDCIESRIDPYYQNCND